MGILRPELPIVAGVPIEADEGGRAVARDDGRIEDWLLRLVEVFRNLGSDNEELPKGRERSAPSIVIR